MKEEKAKTELDALIEEVAVLLDATVRADDKVFHLAVPISPDDEDAEEDAEEDDEDSDEEAGEDTEEDAEEDDDKATLLVNVALSASEDGDTLFVTRRLCAHDGSM